LAPQFTELPGEPATFPGAENSDLDGGLTRIDERLKDWRPGRRCLGGHHLYMRVGDEIDAVIVRPFTTRCWHVAPPGRARPLITTERKNGETVHPGKILSGNFGSVSVKVDYAEARSRLARMTGPARWERYVGMNSGTDGDG